MFKNENVLSQDIAEHFARFFDNKVVNIVSETIVNQSVYNSNDHSLEWISLYLTQILTTRQMKFIIMKTKQERQSLTLRA